MPSTPLSRRDLAKHLACGTGAAVFGLSPAAADDQTTETPSSLDLTMAWLLDRYPSEHFTEDQIAAIRDDVRRKQVQSEILRLFPLEPADAPALVFAAYREEG